MLVAAKNFSQITKKDNIKFLSVSPSNHYKPFGTVVLSEDSLYQEHALIGNERDEDHFAHPLGFNFSGFCGGCNILKLNPPANYKVCINNSNLDTLIIYTNIGFRRYYF